MTDRPRNDRVHQPHRPRPNETPQQETDREMKARLRRIETRVTTMMVRLGIDTEAQKPTFDPGSTRIAGGRVTIPSPHSTTKEILDAIPAGYEGGPVNVFFGTKRVAIITKTGAL